MRDNAGDDKRATVIETQIETMTKKVYVEDYANILIFLIYLTKDKHVILEMLENAKRVFQAHEPFDFEKHADFINRIYSPSQELVLEKKDPKESREDYLRTMDEIEEEVGFQNGQLPVTRDKETEQVLKLNIAFKTEQILGQILRNFPGSLKADIKFEIAKECYFLALRILRAMFLLMEQNIVSFREKIEEILKENGEVKGETELTRRANQIISVLSEVLAYSVIKLLSHSVGSEELKETYKAVLSKFESKPIALTDIAIRLDHFRSIPQKEILELHRQSRKNSFLSTILRTLVVERLYLFPSNYTTRQRLCSKLEISIREPKLITSKTRMLR